ncbi:MAG: hypothetical protein GKS06_18995 [Acidobacteria bacterium]|nr:hypothetical protein [Acidobacteriota bacterium]
MYDSSETRKETTVSKPSPTPDGSHRRYRYAFVARYLKPLVFETMLARGWRQYHVAEWLGMPDHALSEYLTGRSHPSEGRLRELGRLGCEMSRLRRAMLADKLTYWIDTMDIGVDDVVGAVRRIEAEQDRLPTGGDPVVARAPEPQ